MKIQLHNIGMFDNAKFEVGDLTIICGENNTGKTYATYSLYGYLQYMRQIATLKLSEILQQHNNDIKLDNNHLIVPFNTMDKIFSQLHTTFHNDYNKHLHHVFHIKENTASKFSHDMQAYCKKILQSKEKEFGITFKANVYRIPTNNNSLEVFITSTLIGGILGIIMGKNAKAGAIGAGVGGAIGGMVNAQNNTNIAMTTLQNVCMQILTQSFPAPFILSTERMGIAVFHKQLTIKANEMLHEIQNSTDIFTTLYNPLPYPKPITDNILYMQKLSNTQIQKSFIAKEKSIIHTEILKLLKIITGGSYEFSESTISFIPKDSKDSRLDIENISSSAKSLVFLYSYILHKAQKNDILMIDEPELNLHPNNQILVARLLVLLVNAGVKVFITTHSDYIIRELSNCIMLNNLNDTQIEKFKKQGYTKECRLESHKLKAYLAETIKGKNTLKEVKVDSKQGIFMKTFDKPIDSQNDNQGLIFEEVCRTAKNHNNVEQE